MTKTKYGADSSNHAWLVYTAHNPVIRIFKNDNRLVKKPYAVEDVGVTPPFLLSRHKSDDAARRGSSQISQDDQCRVRLTL